MNTEKFTPAYRKPFFLGIDAGGTQTRWALADATGQIIATGAVLGLSGAQMHTEPGRDEVKVALRALANDIACHTDQTTVVAVRAGVTGIGAGSPELARMMAGHLGISADRVEICSDIEIAHRAVLAPGEGYLVYSGTGSIASFIDTAGVLHRAGGRGVGLDDAGGGYWIAREALRRIWRREDEAPGSWQHSPMARLLFAEVGGDSSIFAARFLMERTRGEVGSLAVQVAASADTDALAREVLVDAGRELARLANAMLQRYGARRIVVAGRASQLHHLIQSAMRQAMPANAMMEFRQAHAHIAAARMVVEKYSGDAL